MSGLDQILVAKKHDVEQVKAMIPIRELERLCGIRENPEDFALALKKDRTVLIAEAKKASPSKGVLKEDYDPTYLAKLYQKNGAAAVSILTERVFFMGDIRHLASVREVITLPILRKDFIFDEYQVYESRAYCADAILLIAAILGPNQLTTLGKVAQDLGLACLVEVHDEKDLSIALDAGAKIIGINNRNLATFEVDFSTTEKLRPLVPEEIMVVSESGIAGADQMRQLNEWGVNAALVGEALMTAPDVGAKVKELVNF